MTKTNTTLAGMFAIHNERGDFVAAFEGPETRDAAVRAVNHHEALVGALQDELEAIRVWQSTRGIPADVRDGLQISTAKISAALARICEPRAGS